MHFSDVDLNNAQLFENFLKFNIAFRRQVLRLYYRDGRRQCRRTVITDETMNRRKHSSEVTAPQWNKLDGTVFQRKFSFDVTRSTRDGTNLPTRRNQARRRRSSVHSRHNGGATDSRLKSHLQISQHSSTHGCTETYYFDDMIAQYSKQSEVSRVRDLRANVY